MSIHANPFPLIAFAALVSPTLTQYQDSVPEETNTELGARDSVVVETPIGPLELPSPYSTPSVSKGSKTIDWPSGKTSAFWQNPASPARLHRRERYAEELGNPRTTYIGPNGDVCVVESSTRNSARRITLSRNGNADGTPELREVFAEDLNEPFGVLILGGYFYVANTDRVYRCPHGEG